MEDTWLEISLAFFGFDLAADRKVRAPPKTRILAACKQVRLIAVQLELTDLSGWL